MLMRRLAPVLWILLAATLSLAPPADATSVVGMNLRQLVAGSPSIVYGTVVSAECRWNEDRTMIVTDVRILVVDALKGAALPEVVLTQPGGVIGKLAVDVPGASAFRPGEEAVLFLAPGAGGRLSVNGLAQGRFDVISDPVTGQKTVRGLRLEGMEAVGVTGAAQTPGIVMEPVPLNRFLGGLRALVEDVDAKGGK